MKKNLEKAERSYPIPIPEEEVEFNFVEYIVATNLTHQKKQKLITLMRDQLTASGFREERHLGVDSFHIFLNTQNSNRLYRDDKKFKV